MVLVADFLLVGWRLTEFSSRQNLNDSELPKTIRDQTDKVVAFRREGACLNHSIAGRILYLIYLCW